MLILLLAFEGILAKHIYLTYMCAKILHKGNLCNSIFVGTVKQELLCILVSNVCSLISVILFNK